MPEDRDPKAPTSEPVPAQDPAAPPTEGAAPDSGADGWTALAVPGKPDGEVDTRG